MEATKRDTTRGNDGTEKTEINTLLKHGDTPLKDMNIMKRCLYDPVHKRKVMHSVWIALIFISLGMAFGQSGPTFLDLQIVTNTNTETASLFLTGFSIGFLIGSVLCGVIYDRVNKNLFLLSGVMGVGVFTIITPFCSNVGAMIFIRVICGIFLGVIDAAGNAEQMRVWGNEGTALMQMLHFCFALGGVISPLYSEPFLAVKPIFNSSDILANYSNQSTVLPDLQPETTEVHYAYIITGVICIISGIPWLFIYLQDKLGSRKDVIRPDGAVTQRNIPMPILLYMIFMISLLYMLYCCAEVGFSSFLMTFLVGQFNETKSTGAHITAIFWAFFAGARFFMMFISQRFSALQLLSVSCVLMIIMSVCFTICAMYSAINGLMAFTGILGLSVSAVFPAGFSWTESHLLRVTSRVSASILFSASVGGMITPLIMGYLMENESKMWFCYLLVISICLMVLVFLILFLTSKYIINKRYPFGEGTEVDEGYKVAETNGTI